MKRFEAENAIIGKFIKEGVREYTSLKDLPENFRKDKDLVLKATILNGAYEFKYADESLKQDEDFVIQVLSNASNLDIAIHEQYFDPKFICNICKNVYYVLDAQKDFVGKSYYLSALKKEVGDIIIKQGKVNKIENIEGIMEIYNGKSLDETQFQCFRNNDEYANENEEPKNFLSKKIRALKNLIHSKSKKEEKSNLDERNIE